MSEQQAGPGATVVVTGGSGKLGRACVRDLVDHGYDVVNVDLVPPLEALCPFVQADLEDFGQALEVCAGVDDRHGRVDAVVHLAAIPAPGMRPNAEIFRLNTLSTYNVFEAARRLGIRNVVWASSETVLGLPFDTPPPRSRSTSPTRRGPRAPTRSPRPWGRRWRGTSAAGTRRPRSSACASRT
jgi:nucleoside-diphosphate-sugar epimerase